MPDQAANNGFLRRVRDALRPLPEAIAVARPALSLDFTDQPRVSLDEAQQAHQFAREVGAAGLQTLAQRYADVEMTVTGLAVERASTDMGAIILRQANILSLQQLDHETRLICRNALDGALVTFTGRLLRIEDNFGYLPATLPRQATPLAPLLFIWRNLVVQQTQDRADQMHGAQWLDNSPVHRPTDTANYHEERYYTTPQRAAFVDTPEQRAALRRASDLLNMHLTAEQREALRTRGNYSEYGGDTAWRYQVMYGSVVNVRLYITAFKPAILACLTSAVRGLPVEDVMLAQTLIIRHNERQFIEQANFTGVSRDFILQQYKEIKDARLVALRGNGSR